MKQKSTIWDRLPNLRMQDYLLILLLAILLLLAPFWFPNMHVGDDLSFHLNRIEGLAQAYRRGAFFPSIFYNLFDGIGYGTPLFYGNLSIVFPALLVSLGTPILVTWKLTITLILLLCAISCFFCARDMLKNDYAAFVMSVAFALSGYFATDIFFRATIGEAMSFVFMPIAFLGLNRILRGSNQTWPLLPIGLAFILYCHLYSALITTVGLLLYALCYADVLLHQPRKLLVLMLSTILFFLMSMFYILPMMEQLASSMFRATDGSSAMIYGTLKDRAMPFWTLFSDMNPSLKSLFPRVIKYWLPNGLGISLLLIVFLLIRRKLCRYTRHMLTPLVLCLLALLMSSKLFPWHLEWVQRYLGILQFPWRFLQIGVLFYAMFAGELTAQAKEKSAHLQISRYIILFSLFSFLATYGASQTLEWKYAFNGTRQAVSYQNDIGTGEYLPTNVKLDEYPRLQKGAFCSNKQIGVTDLGESDLIRTVSFSGVTANQPANITINLFYRRAVQADCTLPDGTTLQLPFSQVANGVSVEIDDLQNGTIHLICVPTVRSNHEEVEATAKTALGYGTVLVSFSGASLGDWIEVPLLWYKGYQGSLISKDGTVFELPVESGNLGLCRVSLCGHTSGTVQIHYARTQIQQITLAVSLLTFGAMAVWMAFHFAATPLGSKNSKFEPKQNPS